MTVAAMRYVLSRIAEALGCSPDEDEDLVEAATRLVAEVERLRGDLARCREAQRATAESPASQLDREIEAIRADLENATAREHIDAARGRAKLIGRKLSPEHRATLAAAAEAAELRLRQLEATSTVDAEEVV